MDPVPEGAFHILQLGCRGLVHSLVFDTGLLVNDPPVIFGLLVGLLYLTWWGTD